MRPDKRMTGVIVLFALLLTAMHMSAEGIVGRMIYQLRVVPAGARSSSVALCWSDSARFEVSVPSQSSDDALYGFTATYAYTVGDSVIAAGEFADRYPSRQPGMTVKLRQTDGQAYAEAGASRLKVSVPLGFRFTDSENIRADNPSGLTFLAHTVAADTLPVVRTLFEGSADSLVNYLALSADACEGLWRYLDRDNDPRLAVPGGMYRLATVADGDGGYCIVYLGGAESGADYWQPLMVRGHLIKTPFSGNYDLEWLDAAGRPAARESYGTIDAATGIMTLAFPLLNSTLRFRRDR
ncbi:MAG: hypothetical protein NC127_09560 [Muribaculum sp.]|nr:hypothetical protein [Muribaculum sp.]